VGIVPFDEAYIAKLGHFIYVVSYLEWCVLGDLTHLQGLPSELDVSRLAGKTTGDIGRTIGSHLAKAGDPDLRLWLDAAARNLTEVADLRNHVLHARPATVDERQVLYRWRPPHDAFPITDLWLSEHTAEVETRITEQNTLRVFRPQS
jgi:hypothetical protein